MSRLICKFQVVGPVQTNCYFLYREDTKDCVIWIREMKQNVLKSL